jgi:hypothetical protein
MSQCLASRQQSLESSSQSGKPASLSRQYSRTHSIGRIFLSSLEDRDQPKLETFEAQMCIWNIESVKDITPSSQRVASGRVQHFMAH